MTSTSLEDEQRAKMQIWQWCETVLFLIACDLGKTLRSPEATIEFLERNNQFFRREDRSGYYLDMLLDKLRQVAELSRSGYYKTVDSAFEAVKKAHEESRVPAKAGN